METLGTNKESVIYLLIWMKQEKLLSSDFIQSLKDQLTLIYFTQMAILHIN